jgi:hypothetical protein
VFEMIGDRDRAIQSLRAALAGGYSIEKIQASEVLDELRKTPEYQKLEQEIAVSQREHSCPISD